MEGPEKLICFLEDLIRGCFGDVVRAKGQLLAGDSFLQFDAAGNRYSIRQLESKWKSKIVFIGKRIDRRKIRHRFVSQNAKIQFQNTAASGYSDESFTWEL